MVRRARTYAASMCLAAALAGAVKAQPVNPLTGPSAITHGRTAWMKEGLVISGNWSSVTARRQEIRQPWTQMGCGLSDEEGTAGYRREFSPAMADELKLAGTTLAILPLWSGMGSFEREQEGMEDVRAFSKLLHERGLRVGVYIHDMDLSREFLESKPEARAWLAWPSPAGPYTTLPPPLTQSQGFGVYRNHPGYQAFMRSLIDYAIKEANADLLHFDNLVNGSGWSPEALADFRAFLRMKYSDEVIKKEFGACEGEKLVSLAGGPSPAGREWQLFQGWQLAEAYRKLTEYARSLNREVACDFNGAGIRYMFRRPFDLSLNAPYGDAYWDEGAVRRWDPEARTLETAIRSYKVARLFDQSMFSYTSYRLAMSESMAFNRDCMGNLYWFLYGKLNWSPACNSPAGAEMLPEVRFYREHRDLFNQGETLADVAVWRGRNQNVHGDLEAVHRTALFEQALIVHHVPFQIVFDQHLDRLERYRAVVAADVRLMREDQIDKLLAYAEGGGTLIVTDQTGSLDPWGRPRPHAMKRFFPEPGMGDGLVSEARGGGKVVYTRVELPRELREGAMPPNGEALLGALIEAMGEPTVRVDAPPYVAAEFIRQEGRLLVHLVDYSQGRARDEVIRIRTSPRLGEVVKARLLSPRQGASEPAVESAHGQGEIVVNGLDVYGVVVLGLKPRE